MKTICGTERKTSELLRDLKQLVEIPSVHNERTAGSFASFGEEIWNATDVFLRIAQRKGFSIHDFDGYAVDVQLGGEDDYIGVLVHLDVMGVGERSHQHDNPSQVQEIDGMLCGRGINNDKGPLLAALYAMTRIRQEGHTPYHSVRFIAGGVEEMTWECIEHHFKRNPQPVFGFSPDSNFPIASGEKGILQVYLLLNAGSDASLHYKECLYIICDDLQVIVPKGSDVSFAECTNLIRIIQDGMKITCHGVRALSRNPQRGGNATFKLVKDFHGHLDQVGSLYPMVNMIYESFLDDFYGKRSGLYHKNAVTGCGSVCLMSLNTQGGQLGLCADVRYMRSTDEQSLLCTLRKMTQHYGCEPGALRHKRLFCVAEDSTLIQSLETAYRRVTKEGAAAFTKGETSYVRVLERGVVFGATFPDEDPRPHVPNECIPVKSLLKINSIYYEALVELARTKR